MGKVTRDRLGARNGRAKPGTILSVYDLPEALVEREYREQRKQCPKDNEEYLRFLARVFAAEEWVKRNLEFEEATVRVSGYLVKLPEVDWRTSIDCVYTVAEVVAQALVPGMRTFLRDHGQKLVW